VVIELRVISPRTKWETSRGPGMIRTRIFVLIMVQCVLLIKSPEQRITNSLLGFGDFRQRGRRLPEVAEVVVR
jgi:hypothetical protein